MPKYSPNKEFYNIISRFKSNRADWEKTIENIPESPEIGKDISDIYDRLQEIEEKFNDCRDRINKGRRIPIDYVDQILDELDKIQEPIRHIANNNNKYSSDFR